METAPFYFFIFPLISMMAQIIEAIFYVYSVYECHSSFITQYDIKIE